jgi:predicted protein tyrosine phosphatase
MTIIVCPLSQLQKTLGQSGARHVVTLIRDDELIGREREGLRVNVGDLDGHLWLEMDDIADEMEGLIAPDQAHVEKLAAFLAGWSRAAPLIVHCYAGISRSTAAAFISACIVSPQLSETEIARRLRLASPTARPNSRLIAIADAHLGRQGRMVRAVSEIGDGTGAYEGEPFAIRLD